MKSGPSTPLAFAELVLDSNGERQDPQKVQSLDIWSELSSSVSTDDVSVGTGDF